MRSDNLQLPVYNLQLPHITSNFLMVAMVMVIMLVMLVMLVVVVRTGLDGIGHDRPGP